ncbi:MAG: aminodeoxychorismate synthase component I [Chloroflexi bacterium]|nr:aminodeoxychorismate synthase component I [Chloroflexota bacterium]
MSSGQVLAPVAVAVKELTFPLSPVQAFARLVREPYSFFLDSGVGAGRLGRYSFLGARPFLRLTSRGRQVNLWEEGHSRLFQASPFDALEATLARYRTGPVEAPVPFVGGAVGYFAYDLGRYLERLPSRATDDLSLPEMVVCFYDAVLAFDHLEGRAYALAPDLPGRPPTAERLRDMVDLAREATCLPGPALEALPPVSRLSSNFSHQGYLEAVQMAREYIAAGDIFQVNLSQRFETAWPYAPQQLYLNLRSINPAPFAAYLGYAEVAVVSASPERFLRLQSGRAETRPIKGTRPRGVDSCQDAALVQELLGSAKDRAEHVMIVDLERNDLGRVCRFGTVKVSELMALEPFATVFHLTSTVEGRLRPGKGPLDLVRACFPGGSITGAPKVRAMEIIEDLEPTRRSVYTGSIGYIGFDGTMDLNIAIRTILVTRGRAYFQVGGAVVYDSDLELEYQETWHKARALVQALGLSDATGERMVFPLPLGEGQGEG